MSVRNVDSLPYVWRGQEHGQCRQHSTKCTPHLLEPAAGGPSGVGGLVEGSMYSLLRARDGKLPAMKAKCVDCVLPASVTHTGAGLCRHAGPSHPFRNRDLCAVVCMLHTFCSTETLHVHVIDPASIQKSLTFVYLWVIKSSLSHPCCIRVEQKINRASNVK